MTCRVEGCRRRKDLVAGRCRPCNKERRHQYYLDHYEDSLNRERERSLLKHYGITLAERNAMAVAQDFRCKCCGQLEYSEVGKGRLQVEHCHTCEKIRGLTCERCNNNIGRHEKGKTCRPELIDLIDAYIDMNCWPGCRVRLEVGIRARNRRDGTALGGVM